MRNVLLQLWWKSKEVRAIILYIQGTQNLVPHRKMIIRSDHKLTVGTEGLPLKKKLKRQMSWWFNRSMAWMDLQALPAVNLGTGQDNNMVKRKLNWELEDLLPSHQAQQAMWPFWNVNFLKCRMTELDWVISKNYFKKWI